MKSLINRELERVEKLIQLVLDYKNLTTRDPGEVESIIEEIAQELKTHKANLEKVLTIEKQHEIHNWIESVLNILFKVISIMIDNNFSNCKKPVFQAVLIYELR